MHVNIFMFITGVKHQVTFTSPRAVAYGGWFSYMDKVKAFQQENPDQPLLNISYEEMSLVRIC